MVLQQFNLFRRLTVIEKPSCLRRSLVNKRPRQASS